MHFIYINNMVFHLNNKTLIYTIHLIDILYIKTFRNIKYFTMNAKNYFYPALIPILKK